MMTGNELEQETQSESVSNTDKRRRTEEQSDTGTGTGTGTGSRKRRAAAMFKVIVGGHVFTTSKATLMERSFYFETLLTTSGFVDTDDMEETFEVCVDRDPEPFATLLTFMRTNNLYIDNSSPTFLERVLVEADFYGIADLVENVKIRCTQHLCTWETLSVDKAREISIEKFPDLDSLISHPLFPAMFAQPVQYYKIISTQPANPHLYVEYQNVQQATESLPVESFCTYENLLTKQIFTEPMVFCNRLSISWTSLNYSLIPDEDVFSAVCQQGVGAGVERRDNDHGGVPPAVLVPISHYRWSECPMALGDWSWQLVKRERILIQFHSSDGDGPPGSGYGVLDNNGNMVTRHAAYAEIERVNGRLKSDQQPRLFDYAAHGKLLEVYSLGNFVVGATPSAQ